MPTAAPSLPDWFPAWARDLARTYVSGTTCMLVVHGNVRDLIRVPGAAGDEYVNLPEFLAAQVFGSWDVVVRYDLAGGLKPLAGSEPKRLQGMMQPLTSRLGDPATWPRDPETLLPALDALVERNLLEVDPARRKSLGFVFDYAQYLVPAGDLPSLGRGSGTHLVRFLNWAQNPYIKKINTAFLLIVERLSELNERLVRSPHVSTFDIPLPDREQRRRYCETLQGSGPDAPGETGLKSEALAELSNGLTLVNLQVLWTQGKSSAQGVEAETVRKLKKELIERQCQGLVEFIEPDRTLDMVVGLEAAKARLREDAALLTTGRLEAAPMGYLICGPVGTGKSFLAECYAGSVGIPCIKLRNFRSKYVGETEGNLEQVLNVLRSLGPVVVVIDEADAALGSRSAEGDSGTSSRVFAMIASQMGDTRYRGRIVWMLLTSRPDVLPIDLKRQGRAEVHIPLFYPLDDKEVAAMVVAMARKNKVPLFEGATPPPTPPRKFSGSDIESLVLDARRRALAGGRDAVTSEDLHAAWVDFLPSAQGLEKELQEIAAVLECTQMQFLPPDWRNKVAAPDGRSHLQQRWAELRRLVRE